MGVAGRTAPCDSVGADAVAGALPDTGSALGSKYTTADATSPISTSPSAVLFRGANHLAPRSDEMKSCATRLTLNMSGGIYRPKIRTIKGYDPQAFAGGPSPAERSLGPAAYRPRSGGPQQEGHPRDPAATAGCQSAARRTPQPTSRSTLRPEPVPTNQMLRFRRVRGCSNRDAGSPAGRRAFVGRRMMPSGKSVRRAEHPCQHDRDKPRCGGRTPVASAVISKAELALRWELREHAHPSAAVQHDRKRSGAAIISRARYRTEWPARNGLPRPSVLEYRGARMGNRER